MFSTWKALINKENILLLRDDTNTAKKEPNAVSENNTNKTLKTNENEAECLVGNYKANKASDKKLSNQRIKKIAMNFSQSKSKWNLIDE